MEKMILSFVRTNDYVGYIDKKAVILLEDTFVVIDISNQELKLYKDNGVILTTPVVTGKPSTPTDEGMFEIYKLLIIVISLGLIIDHMSIS